MKREGGGAGRFLARAFTCLLGLAAIAWGSVELPLFWRQVPLDRVASEILQGQTFATPVLMEEAKRIEASEKSSSCNPAALNDAAAIRLAVVDNVMAGRDRTATSAYGTLDQATRAALSCAPADSFEWLTLFWLDLSAYGLTAKNAVFLRLSYALGPNEGWIALRRNRLAISLFPRLPTDLADDAVAEFVNLVNTDSLYPETAEIFRNAAPAVQQRLAKALGAAKPVPRETFARTLYDNGVNIQIPGVERPSRPWD